MSEYQREKNLLHHYDNNLEYYSPLKDKNYFAYMCDTLGVDRTKVNSILDLGCGDGRLCESLESNKGYLGIDYSEKRIKKATNKYPDREFRVSCIHEYCNSQKENYDLAVITEVLEHIEDPYSVIKQLKDYNSKIQIIATVPINLPYVAHLSVWKNEEEVNNDLKPDLILVDKKYGAKHFLCIWK